MTTKILDTLFYCLARFLCARRGKPFVDILEKKCDAFHRILNNVDFNMERNGELRILRIINDLQPRVIFDIGANKGEWSRLVSQMNPSCIIHAFEIVPSTYEELLRSTRNLANVERNNYGLSDKEGVLSVSLGRDSSTATGCRIRTMRFHNEYYYKEIRCKVRKASDYMNERNLKFIDYAKIDVEGMDFRVIKGFGNQLPKVRALQFEYGIFNISSHDLLADFYRHLNKYGFVVGKIFPRCVKFCEYHFDMENFHGSNYIAVRNEERELIERLQSFGA